MQLGWPRPSRRVGGLLSLVLALLVVADLPAVHDHAKPGIYNDECALARLAAGSPRASLSSGPTPLLLIPAPDAVFVGRREDVLPHLSPVSFGPRAPPSADRSLSAH